jgi:ATP-dependent RNA helicase DeaD
MLDMGFLEDIEKILSATPPERQLLFFSATMPRAIQELIRRFSRDPAWIKIESVAQNAPQVEQTYFEVDRRSKIEALTRLIDVNDFRYGIIFCSTKIMVDDLDEHLHARGYMTDRLHGDISQAQRDRVMQKFRERKFEFLVATDVAARGLDVDDLEVVFNFDLPNDAEDYTHRIGRTGRAGRKGQAFTFVSGQEIYKLQSMVRWAKLDIRRGKIPSLDEVEEARTSVFFEKIRSTLEAKKFKPHDRMIDWLLDQGYPSTDICSALIHMLQGAGNAVPATAKAAAPTRPAPANLPAVVAAPAHKPAPAWARAAASRPAPGEAPVAKPKSTPEVERLDPKPLPAGAAMEGDTVDSSSGAVPEERMTPRSPSKPQFERPARTGREPGMATIFLNVGRKQLITPADIVGKIAGVTRLPASIVGALDIHQRHTLVDVAKEHAELVLTKLVGIRVKGVALAPTRAQAETA